MKLKTQTVNQLKGLDRPFSIKGAAAATGKSYLTVRKYIYALEEKKIIKIVGLYITGDRGRPTPLYGNVRVKGKFANHKDKDPILAE